MRGLYRFLTGFYRITFRSPQPERLLNYTLRQNIPIWNIQKREDSLSFSITPIHRRFLAPFLSGVSEKEAVSSEPCGFLKWLGLYRLRYGLILGLLCFFLLLSLSGLFVWTVEVEGNVWISEEQIREKSAQLGLRPGARISDFEPAEFALSFQVENPQFSFVSLNIIGTRAILSVREREEVEKVPVMYDGAANLTSSVSGEILRYEVLSGQICVKRGDVVPQGALLVSGVVEQSNGAFKTVTAKGRVFAKTERYFEVSIPFSETKVGYTGREEVKKRYEILGFSLPSPLFDETDFSSFETTEEQEWLSVWGRKIPILCYTRTYHETAEENRALTVDRAENLAYDKYEEYKRDTLLPGYEILEENLAVTHSEEGVALTVELVLSENIARTSPFSCLLTETS